MFCDMCLKCIFIDLCLYHLNKNVLFLNYTTNAETSISCFFNLQPNTLYKLKGIVVSKLYFIADIKYKITILKEDSLLIKFLITILIDIYP